MAAQVARRTFVRALGQRGSVILVPGGQAELVHTSRMFRSREFVIYTKHKGAPAGLTLLMHLSSPPACTGRGVRSGCSWVSRSVPQLARMAFIDHICFLLLHACRMLGALQRAR